MLVDLTKGPSSKAIVLVQSVGHEPIISFSISSDGSRIFFSSKIIQANEQQDEFDLKTFYINSIEFYSNSEILSWSQPTEIAALNCVDLLMSPSSGNNNFIFYNKVTPSDIDGLMKSEICRLDIDHSEICERFGTESRLLSSSPDGNHFAYTCISDGSEIFIAEFGDLGQGTRDVSFSINAQDSDVVVHKWTEDHIYLSFDDNSDNRLLHALNRHTGSVNLITDQYGRSISVSRF